MTTRLNTRLLAKGVSISSAWKFVRKVDPGLVERWCQAQAAFDLNESGYQARAAAYQRDRGIPRHRPTSREAKALALAEAAVSAKIEELIAQGLVTYAGFRGGELGGSPEAIPLELLAGRRPRGSRVTIRGCVFHDVRLFLAADLATAEPEPVTYPPPTDDRLVETLADLFAESSAWESLGPAKLAPVVAQRDRRFRPGNGIWAAATLVDKIKTLKQVAKAEARARRA